MIANRRTIASLLILAVATGAAIFLLRRDNVRLRAQADALRHKNAAVVQLNEENQRTRELLARAETNEADAKEALHGELLRTQAEVRDLEAQARAALAQQAAAAATLAMNHNPEAGLARLEDFQNVGRATPAAAVQTLVWAALKGDEPALIAALSVTGVVREKIEALLASLPAAARMKYPTPESLAALVVTGTVLDAEAAQVLDTTYLDAQHAIVNVRGAGSEKAQPVPMELGPGGWAVMVPPKMIDKLAKQLSPPPAAPSPSK
jgi:hypothetical protein